jgi:hypothetical protein
MACECDLPIQVGGASLGQRRHICAFFQSAEEEYRVLLPFIKEGLERGEKAFHVVDPQLRTDHLRRLRAAGVDPEAAQESGQLRFCDWDEAYLPDGRFDQERMLAKWKTELDGAVAAGYPRTRLVAHTEWCLQDRGGVEDLLEYEARFNYGDRTRDPVICIYDLNRYSGAFIIDVMRTHPMMIVGGLLQENPFYTPPDEFIRELGSRKPAIHA